MGKRLQIPTPKYPRALHRSRALFTFFFLSFFFFFKCKYYILNINVLSVTLLGNGGYGRGG